MKKSTHMVAMILCMTVATVYADSFIGKVMKNGEKYSDKKITCAYNKADIGDEVYVCYDGKCLWIPVTDRLHKKHSDRIDLSHKAMIHFTGTDYNKITVKIKKIRKGNKK